MSLATASRTVKFHEFPEGTVVHNYQPGTQIDGPIRSISWSKDGNWLALVPCSGSVEIVSVKEQLKLIHTIQGIEEPSCASFQNTTKKNIAVGTKSGQVLIYDIKARNVKKRYPRATSVISIVEFTVKDNHVVAACESGEAFIYSNVTNSMSGSFKIPRSQSVSALRTNPIKRNLVVAGSNEGVVAVWDIHANKNKFFIGSHKAPVTAAAFSPINSDLVVSAGLDRQFCFYDIGANKCIGNIFVENSMMSVDFSPDGKFVVMGSQEGKIYVYDSKNIQKPVRTFPGHGSAVHHLSFRKSEDYETSFINLSNENVKESVEVENQRNNESSFGLNFLPPHEGPSVVGSHASAETTEDSFMAAMGLNQNNTTGSIKADVSLKLSETNKKFSMFKSTPPTANKILQEKFQGDHKTLLTSTPNCVVQEMGPLISPIVPMEPPANQNKVDMDDLKEFIKNSIRDEMRVVSEEIRNEVKYYSTHNLTLLRQMNLDIMMTIVKEFIKVENNVNGLRAELAGDGASNHLYEENEMLKQRIAELSEELSVLKNNGFNNNQ